MSVRQSLVYLEWRYDNQREFSSCQLFWAQDKALLEFAGAATNAVY